MLIIKFISVFFLTLYWIGEIVSAPVNDKALYNNDDDPYPEERRRRKRPCRGGRSDDQGRTFFDWSYQVLDVNYNYNYNINCGGSGGGGAPSHDSNNDVGLFGGGHKPHKPHRPQHQQGGSGWFSNLFNQAQQHTQGIFDGVSSLIPQNPGSWLPQGDFFNGQGISSLFQNGLFSGIFQRPQSSSPPLNNNRPPAPVVTEPPEPVTYRPPPLTPLPIYTPRPTNPPTVRPPPPRPTTRPPPRPPPVPSSTPSNGGGGDPDDLIYNDERPVHADHDPVVPDAYSNYRPGSYYNRRGPYYQQRYRSNNIRFT